MRLDPLSLKLFVSVSELHSIAAAAAAAHMAPAAVSKRLSELEHQLNTALLVRTNKGVQPTPAGHALVNLARRLLLDLEDIAVQMRDWSGGTRGHVRVFSNISAITQFLPREIAAFLQAWPDVEVHLQERISTAVVKAVLENEADVGICVQGDDMQGLEVLPYHDDELVLIVPEAHPLARRKRVPFADTVAYPYVGLHTGSAINRALERASLEAQQPLHLRIQVTSFDALSRMVEAGLGIGLMPASFAQPLARSLGIRVVALAEPWTRRRLVLCMRSYAGLPTAARLLVDALRKASAPAAPAARR